MMYACMPIEQIIQFENKGHSVCPSPVAKSSKLSSNTSQKVHKISDVKDEVSNRIMP